MGERKWLPWCQGKWPPLGLERLDFSHPRSSHPGSPETFPETVEQSSCEKNWIKARGPLGGIQMHHSRECFPTALKPGWIIHTEPTNIFIPIPSLEPATDQPHLHQLDYIRVVEFFQDGDLLIHLFNGAFGLAEAFQGGLGTARGRTACLRHTRRSQICSFWFEDNPKLPVKEQSVDTV